MFPNLVTGPSLRVVDIFTSAGRFGNRAVIRGPSSTCAFVWSSFIKLVLLFFPLQIQKFLINLCNYILCLSHRDPALLQWWSGSTMRRWLFCLAWWLTPHMFTDSTNLRALKKELSDSLNCTLRPFYQSSECVTAKYISMEASETNNKKNPVSMETNMS